MLWPWRGRVTADMQNWLELAGTGATGVKRCLHYEISEKSRSIVGGASVTVCGKKRKGTGKTGNFTGKSDIITVFIFCFDCLDYWDYLRENNYKIIIK